MKISCIQMNSEFCAPDKNFARARRLVEKAAAEKPDVIVLPEMWNVGFFPKENLRGLSDVECARVSEEIGALSNKLNVNIVAGSVANSRKDGVYNTSCVFSENGECIAEYDKTHLFSPMGEDKFFKEGNKLCRFEISGIKCGIIICYDLRFPELSRKLATDGLDVLFVVSQWPQARISQMKALARARAIENQVFVALCNSPSYAGEIKYGGNSVIFDPFGEPMAEAGEDEEIISAVCNLDILSGIRKSINVFCDRRTDLYK